MAKATRRTEKILVRRREQIVRRAPGTKPMPIFLTTDQLAAWLGVRAMWVTQGRLQGYGPPYCKVQGVVRYHQDDVIRWLRAKVIDPELKERLRLAG